MKRTIATLILSLFLVARQTPTPEQPLQLTPGGDCVVNVNPVGTSGMASFDLGYDFDGNENVSGGKTSYSFEIDSQVDPIHVGYYSGSDRPHLSKGVAYAIRITDFTGTPSALVYEIGNPLGTARDVSVLKDTSNYKSTDFSIVLEEFSDDGVDYGRLVVIKGGTAVLIDVNE